MKTIILDVHGRLTLDDDLLRHLEVAPGDKVSVDRLPNGVISLRADKRTGRIEDVFGSLKRDGQRTVSIEEMNEAIEKGWAGEP